MIDERGVDVVESDHRAWATARFGVRAAQVGPGFGGWQLDDLIVAGLRRNPRRGHLWVSRVLGKHVPARPSAVIAAGDDLADAVAALLAAETDVTVFGFAETATGLGHVVAERLRAPRYLHSTRRRVAGATVLTGFTEGHSHATDHLITPGDPAILVNSSALVLVDDEISTGKTAFDAIEQLHRVAPRARYVVSALIDLRSGPDRERCAARAAALGAQVDFVALVRGRAEIPADLASRVSALPGPSLITGTESGACEPIRCAWPPDLPDGGRHGIRDDDRGRFAEQVDRIAATIVDHVDRDRPLVVVGHEELMYLPLRVAAALDAELDAPVYTQTTTRSPAYVVDDPGYPLRRGYRFIAPETDVAPDRYLYNAEAAVPGARLVVLVDPAADTDALTAPGGLVSALRAGGDDPLVVVVGGTAVTAVRGRATSSSPEPLRGPDFGSYAPDEVGWLLTDLSHVDLEADVALREQRIQSGVAHYAESLPVEYQPDERYGRLFDEVLEATARRLAVAVGAVTELVLAERGDDVVLASLARAGTPVGILMRRWAAAQHGLELPHYAVSIIRDRGIDRVAMGWLAAHHDPSRVVFVDGWTGKGAIAGELREALADLSASGGPVFDPDLAVLADPGSCVRTFGTRDDFLIASACLNSTVSGLVSRTVLNADLIGPDDFHGAKFYADLADADVSGRLLDAVSAWYPTIGDDVTEAVSAVRGSDRLPTWAGWRSVEDVAAHYGIESVNFVKPGVGETTRVLLRRVPWRVLVRRADDPEHAHIRALAEARGVPIDVVDDLAYSCVGLIRTVS
ncbi:phosphoribosyltransferase [Williamsia sterculiae]|uniref:PELOTA RNA binding domain-containing protein n=1 Tax=Williamsia sterculiae TaxID=1344003 RepID=A0A1N7EP15_9NOCA|nr:phosphoribosyltransferase [Williamsia sterculiae]SIR89820.1 PELOTA RNA binding domain-containing protein [Williamsia sterculiae]